MTTVEQFARHYIQNMGFAIVPLQPRSKRCTEDGWPNRVFGPADISPTGNIGLRLIDGLVVLDDDSPNSHPECDQAFLLRTDAVWGRDSKWESKRLYRCPDLTETITFTDIDGSHLLQLRVGLQDMAPPSIHPDTGERLKWSGLLLPPREISREHLIDSVRYRWTVGLLAKYWPERNRHNLRLAYARVLLDTLGIPPDHAKRILTWVCRLGGSDSKGVADAETAIRNTQAKLTANQPATGANTVADILGETGRQIIRTLRKAYGKTSPLDEAIESLNERHAIVSIGSKVVVMETWPDGGIKTLWSFDEFKRRHSKDFVEVAGRRRRLADVWLDDPRGRSHERLVYVMPGSQERCDPGDYNGYLGFTVKPTPGNWSKNREHLRCIICHKDEPSFTWLMNWMAALVQQPGRHALSAVVLRGGQGTGKGHFAHQMLGALFHKQQYLHIIGGGMLTGRFNEHLSGKVLVFADESTWGGDPGAADKLKGMITESTIPIERKFLPLVEEPSALHIVIASNNDWPISIPMDDRRFMVLDVADSERQNDAYFAPLREELAAGGLAAMLSDLLAHPVDQHALRHPPSTSAKRGVMAQSLKPIERWWFEKLQDEDTWDSNPAKDALHGEFMSFLDRHRGDNRTRRATETELGQFLKKQVPTLTQQRLLVPGTNRRERVWNLPSLDACRAAWVATCHWPENYDWAEQVG